MEADPDAPTEPPNAPRTVRIVDDTNTSLTLTWDAPDGGTAVTEYRVQWLTAGEGFANARRDGREAVVDASARSHTITGLTMYGFYQVRVLGSERRGREQGIEHGLGLSGAGRGPIRARVSAPWGAGERTIPPAPGWPGARSGQQKKPAQRENRGQSQASSGTAS